MSTPDYIKIYTDLINRKYPERMHSCADLLSKKDLSVIDVITLEKMILQNKDAEDVGKFRSYRENDIVQLLLYQKKHQLNNTQMASVFRLSRNTIAKWKKMFSIKTYG
ncbi:helix-turn-helix domain-containing protein [Chryseobacterium sp. RRHN12]|uniref:helix-turn-helix domain-containing protein n=1 Tax=Chryseobacterium sp. RRHN12 TaxID=3437884 RepID=UPI003D9B5DB8